jgi:hypothetical protein
MTEMPREIPLSSGRGIVLACLMTFDRDLRITANSVLTVAQGTLRRWQQAALTPTRYYHTSYEQDTDCRWKEYSMYDST